MTGKGEGAEGTDVEETGGQVDPSGSDEPTAEGGDDPVGDPPEPKEPSGTSVEDRIAEAKARHDRGEPILGDEEEEDDAAPESEEGEEADAEAHEGGEEAEEEEEAGAEAEAEPEGEEEGEDDAGEEEFVDFALPPRNPDGPEELIQVPAELQEDFARLRNGYMRGEQLRVERARFEKEKEPVLEQKREIDMIRRELQEDPVGFIEESMPKGVRQALLLSLMADDEVWEDDDLQDKIREWERSPRERERFQVETERDRLKAREKRRHEDAVRAKVQEGVRATGNRLIEIADQVDPEKRDKFIRFSMDRLGERAGQTGETDFAIEEIVEVLDREGILDGFGVDVDAVLAQEEDAKENGSSSKGKKKAPARARRVSAKEAREAGEKMAEGSKRRRAAAAYAPSGAGAAAANAEPPKGQTVEERIKWAQKKGMASVLSS